MVTPDGAAILDDEPIARVLTSPGMFTNEEILTQRLTAASAGGVSIIRAGASDGEILATIQNLLENQAVPQTLIGAVVIGASAIRSLGDPERWFGVYHTDAPAKFHHGDILATVPEGSGNQKKKLSSERRYLLRDVMKESIVYADTAPALLAALRAHGL